MDALVETLDGFAFNRGFSMKLQTIRLSNFQSFGEEPTERHLKR